MKFKCDLKVPDCTEKRLTKTNLTRGAFGKCHYLSIQNMRVYPRYSTQKAFMQKYGKKFTAYVERLRKDGIDYY